MKKIIVAILFASGLLSLYPLARGGGMPKQSWGEWIRRQTGRQPLQPQTLADKLESAWSSEVQRLWKKCEMHMEIDKKNLKNDPNTATHDDDCTKIMEEIRKSRLTSEEMKYERVTIKSLAKYFDVYQERLRGKGVIRGNLETIPLTQAWAIYQTEQQETKRAAEDRIYDIENSQHETRQRIYELPDLEGSPRRVGPGGLAADQAAQAAGKKFWWQEQAGKP